MGASKKSMAAALLTKCARNAGRLFRHLAPRPMQLRLQSHIVALFLLLIVVLQVGGVLLINAVGMTTARKSIGEDLVAGSVVLNQLLKENSDRALWGARLIASDYTLRRPSPPAIGRRRGSDGHARQIPRRTVRFVHVSDAVDDRQRR